MRDCVAMLLAGGEGKRLGKLTNGIAKPAVHFGGKYRIIDFTLSNCTNSGIETVGVLTQYSPLELNKHIGNGKAWDLHHPNKGATILSPYQARDGGDWYKGTADAIYQQLHFIDQYDPEYVLIISGDHIYQMDYCDLLEEHKQSNADVTISVIPVKWEEASRFGILNTNDDLQIYEFEEKPAMPKSNLASMGIYMFTWKKLKEYLIRDAENECSSHDFGKDLIPKMLHDECKLMAYRFDGYWRDVGTIQSYYDANMDVLENGFELVQKNQKWTIYSNEKNESPQFVTETGEVRNSLVQSGCMVHGHVENSILFHQVHIEPGCEITQSIIHPRVTIGKNTVLHQVIVMEDVIIPDNMYISSKYHEEPLVLDQKKIEELKVERVEGIV